MDAVDVDRQIDRYTDRQIDRMIDRQIYREKKKRKCGMISFIVWVQE